MASSWRFGLAITALGLILGAVAGYLSAPRYRPPADGGEQRLRQRAEQFYRAAQVNDYLALARLYTPAFQLDRPGQLAAEAERRQRSWQNFKPETRATLEQGAQSIRADGLAVEREGDWAVTSGKLFSRQGELEIPIPLTETVWVRSGGDWWVYQMTPAELNAYGNPPDFARRILILQSQAGQMPGDIEVPINATTGEETPAEDGDGGGTAEAGEPTTGEMEEEAGETGVAPSNE